MGTGMKILSRILFGLLVFAAWDSARAQDVFTKYGPVAGIQKSTGLDYHNTAAASTDVVSLWSGTCDATHFLAGNGTCAIPGGVAPSGAANFVYATPNGSSGSATLRALVGADQAPINLGSTANGGVLSTSILLGTNGGTSNGFFSVTGPATSLKTFTFPNASATVLTTNAAVTVAQGGTGLATLTANGVLLGEGTSNVNPLVMGADTVLRGTASADPVATAVPNCGSSSNALSYSTSTHTFGCQAITGTATPGGATTNVQFNLSGVMSGDSGLTYAGSGGLLTHSATVNGILQFTQTNSSNGTAAASQIVMTNDVPHNAYFGNAGSGNTGSQWIGGPTGEQLFIGTGNSVPIVFGTNAAYRGQLTGAGVWQLVGGTTNDYYGLNGTTNTVLNGLALPSSNTPTIYAGGVNTFSCTNSATCQVGASGAGAITAGNFKTASANSAACASGSFCSTISTTSGNHFGLVLCTLASAGDSANYDTVAIYAVNGSALTLTVIKTSALGGIQAHTQPSTIIDCKQGSGATQAINGFLTQFY